MPSADARFVSVFVIGADVAITNRECGHAARKALTHLATASCKSWSCHAQASTVAAEGHCPGGFLVTKCCLGIIEPSPDVVRRTDGRSKCKPQPALTKPAAFSPPRQELPCTYIAHIRQSRLWILAQAQLKGLLGVRREILRERKIGIPLQDPGMRRRQVVGVERSAPGQHFEQHAAERPDVGAAVGGNAPWASRAASVSPLTSSITSAACPPSCSRP